jgi:hypothetical protein
MHRALLLMFVISISCSATFAQTLNDETTNAKRGDDSDWWSITRVFDKSNIKPEKRLPAASNFVVLGIRLEDNDEAAHIIAKLGQTTFVSRGDAAIGRFQACYVSENSPRVYLIFEQGELDSAFYLFSGGPDWHGTDWCAKSQLISSGLKTGSGLALGQTRSQVEAILGKPTAIRTDLWVYSGEVLVKPAGRSESYYVDTEIDVRFSTDRLTYLGVMKSEVEP